MYETGEKVLREPKPADSEAYPNASWGPLSGLGIAILSLFFGLLASIPFLALDSQSASSLSLETTVAIQVATALGFVFVPIIAAASLNGSLRKGLKQLGFVGFRLKTALAWSGIGILGYLAFALVYITAFGTPEQDDIAGEFGPLPVQILLIVIAAPLAEEICFRGLLFRGFRTRLPFWISALLAASIFGLLHYSTGVSAIPLLIVLGFIFALVYEKTRSLWPAIILHAANNGLALIALSAA
jgi:membrane protease YdiL (CAAX protease family)